MSFFPPLSTLLRDANTANDRPRSGLSVLTDRRSYAGEGPMITLNDLPQLRIENLPIPVDIQPDDSWPASLVEMALHIGPYSTLLVADRFGGLDLYMPHWAESSAAWSVIGLEKARILCRVYDRESMAIPVAGEALRRARRRDVLRAVLDRRIGLTEAAYIMRTSRRYVLKLVEEFGLNAVAALS
jgi:hypothetical protein